MSLSANAAADKESDAMTLFGFILYSLGFIIGTLWKLSIPLLRAAAKSFLRATDPAPRAPVPAQTKSDIPVKPIPSTSKNVKTQEQSPVILIQTDENPSDKGSKAVFTRPPVLTEVDLEDDTPFTSKKSFGGVIRPL